jgi:hypothetical protein
MLLFLAIVLTGLWLVGLVTSYTIGGLIHLLLAVPIILVVVRMIKGRQPLC